MSKDITDKEDDLKKKLNDLLKDLMSNKQKGDIEDQAKTIFDYLGEIMSNLEAVMKQCPD